MNKDDRGSDIGEDSTLLPPEDPADVAGGVPVPAFDGLAYEVDCRRVHQALFGGTSRSFELGRYVITGTLGRGGMGVVFKAFDPELDRRVAIKLLHTELDERHTTRLRREAQAMAKLSHPNVVQVYEVGTVEGQTFVAMELVQGQTLEEWIRQDPRPSWRQCVEVFVQVGKGLAAAHERGLVHRDFKPGNAIIDEEGRPRVLDFGLARQADDVEDPPSDVRSRRVRSVQSWTAGAGGPCGRRTPTSDVLADGPHRRARRTASSSAARDRGLLPPTRAHRQPQCEVMDCAPGRDPLAPLAPAHRPDRPEPRRGLLAPFLTPKNLEIFRLRLQQFTSWGALAVLGLVEVSTGSNDTHEQG